MTVVKAYVERYCFVHINMLWYFPTFLSVLYVCTVHGFASVSYIVIEAEQLTTTFGPNVKGSSLLGANIGGQIIAEAGTARTFLTIICTFCCTYKVLAARAFSTVFQQAQYQLLP